MPLYSLDDPDAREFASAIQGLLHCLLPNTEENDERINVAAFANAVTAALSDTKNYQQRPIGGIDLCCACTCPTRCCCFHNTFASYKLTVRAAEADAVAVSVPTMCTSVHLTITLFAVLITYTLPKRLSSCISLTPL